MESRSSLSATQDIVYWTNLMNHILENSNSQTKTKKYIPWIYSELIEPTSLMAQHISVIEQKSRPDCLT